MSRTLQSALAALVLLAASLAQATVVAKLSTEQLTQKSHRVVRGTVKAAHSAWTPDRRRIVTYYQIDVLESFKGEGAVEVVVVGGEMDGVAAYPSGFAKMTPGEEVVLFLEKSPLQGFVPISMSAAVYRVARQSGQALVRRNLEGLSLAVLPPGGAMRLEEPKPIEPMGTLDEVRAAIQRGLGR